MATVTVGELRDYLKEVADAVVNGKMQVTDADVKTVLDTIKSVLQSGVNTYDTNALAELQAIKNKLNGTLLTQLTGRNAEEVVIVNAEALTDTTTRLTANIDVTKYREFDFRIINTLADGSGNTIDLKLGFNIGVLALNVPKLDGTYLAYAAGELGSTGIFNRIRGYSSARSSYLSMQPLVYANTGVPLTTQDIADLQPWKKIRNNQMRITYKAGAAPASGSVSIILVGVPN